jgi:hypothetical protein
VGKRSGGVGRVVHVKKEGLLSWRRKRIPENRRRCAEEEAEAA